MIKFENNGRQFLPARPSLQKKKKKQIIIEDFFFSDK
jgi:hypothetical protein